jgi:competence protein ComEC
MQESPVNFKALIGSGLFSLLVVAGLILYQIADNRTKVVFCDVGQGDAAYIRIKNQIDILVDAGPDSKVLNCLGKYMPFFDRKIEIAILTHPEKDHFGGFSYLVDRYRIDNLLLPTINSQDKTFSSLIKKMRTKKINIEFVLAGLSLSVKTDKIRFYWPANRSSFSNLNNESLVFTFQENNHQILFTGDAEPPVWSQLFLKVRLKTDILKVPHHGSKNGLSKKLLQLADPTLAVISVGKNNPYGHPAKEVLDLLRASKKKYLRTDELGDIVFKLN